MSEGQPPAPPAGAEDRVAGDPAATPGLAPADATDPCAGLGDQEACDEYVTCLLKFFDSRLRAAQGRFTADGRSYLEDISRAYICYSYHTSGKGKATWWPGEFGEYYWKYHANRLAVAFNQLVEDDPQRMLNGRDVRDAMADIGRTFKAALTRRLRTLSLEELQTVVTNREVEEDEADDPDSWKAQRIQEILSGCPI